MNEESKGRESPPHHKQVADLARQATHDIRGIVALVNGHIRDIRNQVKKGHLDQEFVLSTLDSIEYSVTQAYQTAQQMDQAVRLNYHPFNRNLDLNDVLWGSKKILEEMAGSLYVITGSCSAPLLNVDSNQLYSALQNLVCNAMHAMPEGGNIEVCAGEDVLQEPLYKPYCTIPLGNYAVVEVSDQGRGIPDHIKETLFDPGVSTKEKSRGQGLAIVREVMQRHEGYVIVESSDDEGTTFSLYFPLTNK